jgi:hypothetical protein
MKKALTDSEYTPEETAKRAEEIIRRAFAMPHTPRKAITPQTTRGQAQRKRRSKASPRSR